MRSGKKKVTLWCKEARFQTGSTLQERLSVALKRSQKISSRKEEIADKEFRFINDHWELDGVQYGIAFVYEQDKSALLVEEDEEASVIKLQEMVPPDDGDKKRQFLDGMLYFMVYKNHVLIVQSSAFRVQAFEDHLRWLLEKSGALARGQAFGLADRILEATRARIRNAHVRGVTISSPLVADVGPPVSGSKAPSKMAAVKDVVLKGFGRDVLEKIAPDFLKNNRLQAALDTNIECSLNIRYKYSITDQGQSFLDDVAVALRGVEGAEAVISLDDGTTIRGEELRLTGWLNPSTTNGVINANTLFAQMHGWLREQVESGNLSA